MDGWNDYRKECQLMRRLGKDNMQALQDSLAEMLGLSFCLWDRSGQRITVWSNSSLFCYEIISKNKERCKKQKQIMLSQVLDKKETVIGTCYMGMSFFAIPILYEDEVMAIFYGGGFVSLSQGLDTSYITRLGHSIPAVPEERLHNVINFFENFFKILKLDDNLFTNEDKKIKPHKEDADVFLLQNHLSLREIEIVKLVLQGMSNKEIADYLGISEKTVKVHVSNILRKLQMKDRRQLIIFCQQQLGKR